MSNVPPTRDLMVELVSQHRLPEAELHKVVLLKDLLYKCLTLDSVKRASVNDALAHPFLAAQ